MNYDLMMAVLAMNAYRYEGNDSVGEGQSIGFASRFDLEEVDYGDSAFNDLITVTVHSMI